MKDIYIYNLYIQHTICDVDDAPLDNTAFFDRQIDIELVFYLRSKKRSKPARDWTRDKSRGSRSVFKPRHLADDMLKYIDC